MRASEKIREIRKDGAKNREINESIKVAMTKILIRRALREEERLANFKKGESNE